MRAKWKDGVYEVLSSGAFADWLDNLDAARNDRKRARARHDELLTQVNLLEFRAELAHRNAIDTLEEANFLEDESATLANEAAELENASFELVSQFELQRDRTTKKWEALGAIDVMIEEAEAKDANYEAERLKKKRIKVNEEYEREDRKKQQLWSEVNTMWERSIDRDLALKEKQQKSKLVRAEAERLFQKYDGEAQQAAALKKDAEKMAADREASEQRFDGLMEEAREKFSCILHNDFLYWISREDNQYVYCTPLIDDKENYSVPLDVGQIYRCHHSAGIDGLERIVDIPSASTEGMPIEDDADDLNQDLPAEEAANDEDNASAEGDDAPTDDDNEDEAANG